MKNIYSVLITAFFITILFQSAQAENFVNRYEAWKNGPPQRPDYFPIAVWLQNPSNAKKYHAIGINLYVGLWKGPTKEQLSILKNSGMQVICHQNAFGLSQKDDPAIVGWMHDDEPDNAQPITDPETGQRTYGPPIPPEKVIEDYEELRAKDPTRPVFLNLGQGVANDEWKGRGKWGKKEDYLSYWKGCDILSYDVYPVAGLGKSDGENYLWYVARGVQRLREWSQGQRTIWNCIECTHISHESAKATPEQVKAEVWMSIIHGSMGILYFVHEFKPQFNEDALLDDPVMREAVAEINRRIHSLAPVLNSPTVGGTISLSSSNSQCPLAAMCKKYNGKIYVFTAGMRNAETKGVLKIENEENIAERKINVLFENREIDLKNNQYEDHFSPYDVHIYEIEL
ncbi:MAG: hypothetical protein JXR73_01350 [Candidatus Omnitrophica bacterium]|nr:hypothetical protein [Candidatus Omnitrophota bacterium]